MAELLSLCPVCEQPATKKCSACNIFKYCSQACQRKHWIKYHKKSCLSINSKDTALAFVANLNKLIQEEADDHEHVYWFGTLMKVAHILVQFMSKEEIASQITQPQINMMITHALNLI